MKKSLGVLFLFVSTFEASAISAIFFAFPASSAAFLSASAASAALLSLYYTTFL